MSGISTTSSTADILHVQGKQLQQLPTRNY